MGKGVGMCGYECVYKVLYHFNVELSGVTRLVCSGVAWIDENTGTGLDVGVSTQANTHLLQISVNHTLRMHKTHTLRYLNGKRCSAHACTRACMYARMHGKQLYGHIHAFMRRRRGDVTG